MGAATEGPSVSPRLVATTGNRAGDYREAQGSLPNVLGLVGNSRSSARRSLRSAKVQRNWAKVTVRLATSGVSAVGYTLASSVLARLATVVRTRPAVARSSAGKSKIREVISSMAV